MPFRVRELTDPREVEIANSMKEAALREHVRALCQSIRLPVDRRIRIAFVYDSRHSPKGWPDLVLSGRKGLLFRELKTMKGRPTPEQSEWLADLQRHGLDAGIWRPVDLLVGRIAAELDAIR